MSVDFITRKIDVFHWVLQIREWDGYDRPHYTPVMTIDEEEKDLDKNRFRNYISGPTKISLSHYVFVSNFEIQKMITWISENTEGKWTIKLEGLHPEQYMVKFEKEEDAVLCKMMVPL